MNIKNENPANNLIKGNEAKQWQKEKRALKKKQRMRMKKETQTSLEKPNERKQEWQTESGWHKLTHALRNIALAMNGSVKFTSTYTHR